MSLDQFLVCEKNKIIENIIAYCVKEYVKVLIPQHSTPVLPKGPPWARATKNVNKPHNQMCESCT